jgi:hypothetical protein
VAITGSTDGRPHQLAGMMPATRRPGLAYRGADSRMVASTVLPVPPAGRDAAACRAGMVGSACRAGRMGSDWPALLTGSPPADSVSPTPAARTATPNTATPNTATPITGTTTVARVAPNRRFAKANLTGR